MSAKRRQETIAQFSVPLGRDDMDNEVSTARRRAGGDDDFLDDEDDDCTYTKGQGKKKAGTTKPQGKGKNKVGRSRQGVNGSSFSGQNPKVLLLSLKAVCARC